MFSVPPLCALRVNPRRRGALLRFKVGGFWEARRAREEIVEHTRTEPRKYSKHNHYQLLIILNNVFKLYMIILNNVFKLYMIILNIYLNYT